MHLLQKVKYQFVEYLKLILKCREKNASLQYLFRMPHRPADVSLMTIKSYNFFHFMYFFLWWLNVDFVFYWSIVDMYHVNNYKEVYKYEANSIIKSISMFQFNMVLNLLIQWKPSFYNRVSPGMEQDVLTHFLSVYSPFDLGLR